MILLDPYYRTIEGFCILIEKEWVQAGLVAIFQLTNCIRFPFEERTSYISFAAFCWLIYSLLSHYNTQFEFNEEFLLFLLDSFLSYEVYFPIYSLLINIVYNVQLQFSKRENDTNLQRTFCLESCFIKPSIPKSNI